MKLKRILAVTLLSFAMCACGGEKEEVREVESSAPREREPEVTDPGAVADPEPEPEPEPVNAGPSLAKRMEGKYSYHLSGENGEDEYLIINMISFGDNLYAYCGQAMADDSGELEAYSFWATEFIPDDASVMQSADAESVDVTALSFSVMSNAGKYWNSGVEGKISLDSMGLVFEDFGHDDFLVPSWDDSRLFQKDDRVEDIFVYLNHDIRSGDKALQGYWVCEACDAPVYLYFEGSDVYLYSKAADGQVSLSAGGCYFTTKHFECTANTLGSGYQPWTWEADYDVNGDTLTLDFCGDVLPGGLYDCAEFKRADEKDIHVYKMSEIEFDDDSFGMNSGVWEEYVDDYANGFYGIWTAAEKDRDSALERAQGLCTIGYSSYVAYSPEWADLNDDPYFCVTAGRYETEKEAMDELDELKASGYKDAYVKFSGAHDYIVVTYYNYGESDPVVNNDSVVLKNVSYTISYGYDPLYGEESYVSDLVIDKNTVWDKNCETLYFGNYEDGDTPLDWYLKNLDYMENDPDAYMSSGPALSGVFEVGITGNHIDRFLGSYWWD